MMLCRPLPCFGLISRFYFSALFTVPSCASEGKSSVDFSAAKILNVHSKISPSRDKISQKPKASGRRSRVYMVIVVL